MEEEAGMRGTDREQSSMFSYISAEGRVPKDHPLRAIRVMVDAALKELGPRLDGLYATGGRRRLGRRSCCAGCCCRCSTAYVASAC